MSDKYVSVPRELLERLQAALSTSYCPELSLTTELWKLLAAPAKDVRAVGYASDNQLARLAKGAC